MTTRTEYNTPTPNKPSLFDVQYLRNHWTLDIGVLGYIGIVWPKKHSPEVRSFPPGTPCIYKNITNIPPIMTINRIFETQKLLSLYLVSFLVGLRNYQHLCIVRITLLPLSCRLRWTYIFFRNVGNHSYGRQKSCIRGFGGESEGKRPFGRTRRRWEDNPKIDLQEV